MDFVDSPDSPIVTPRPFVHLHCHTQYSMLDGANRLPDLIDKVKREGMNAVAITDHGNLYGAFEFYSLCQSEGIKPIVGYEAYVAPGNRRDRGATKMKEASFHLTLLAMNKTGYFNLIKLASLAYLEGFYYRPRIDKETLAAHNEGLICLSGCAASELSQHILGDRMDEAKKLLEWYIQVFGDRLYLEIQNAGLEIQRQCLEGTVDLAKQFGLPLVATNDAHYLNREDAAAHDVLLCVSTRTTVNDEKRMRMDCDQFYVRSPEEMYAAFPGMEEAVKMSQVIADRVDIELDKNPKHYPKFQPPGELTDKDYLRQLCEKGLRWRYGDAVTDQHRQRLEFELSVIDQMGYSSYFLIVWDFVRFANENDIPCGARGSACGAMVAYVLGLSHVCPLQYDLLFERFLDPSRTEPPDIDIDFCRDGRQKVIDYTKQRYGAANVCQIGTFGTLKAKLAIRDVGRALGIPLTRVDQIAKSVPDELNIKLKDAIQHSPDLKEAYDNDPEIHKLLDIAQKLEGLSRSAGTHAAGVVVSDAPIDNYIPLQTISGKEDVVTQWDGPHVEQAGLLKMDFLGLRNLTILHKAVQNVKKHRGIDIDPDKLPVDDPLTYELLQRGETKGVFQFEGGGIRDLLTKMKPDRFADIIATSALYRPGPLEGGMVMDYVDIKHGRKEPNKFHPLVDAVLEETYGVMVYQEQVMRILNRVGGIDLADAYKCIKAISKKKEKTIAGYFDGYVKGAVERGVSQQVAKDLFELITKFAGYGFNKCVVAETVIVHAKTGERTTVGDLFRNRQEFAIHSLGDDGKLRVRRVADVVWNGRKQVFRVTTSQGKTIVATGNHPFRTFDGWTNLEDLQVGDRIAAPRRLDVTRPKAWPEHELIVLAGLLSEGNTCHPSSLYFHNDNLSFAVDFASAAEQFPNSVVHVMQRQDGKRRDVCVNTGSDTRFQIGQRPWNARRDDGDTLVTDEVKTRAVSGAFLWAEKLGITGKKADSKFVPSEVFTLNASNLALFLGRLWAGDGFVGAPGQMPYYATSSRRLARDVQELLLRLGIQSGVHQKAMKYRHQGNVQERLGLTVHLVGRESIDRFMNLLAPHMIGRDQQLARYRCYLAETDSSLTSKDTVPAGVRILVNEERQRAGLTWRDLEAQSDVSIKEFCRVAESPAKKGFRRTTVSKLADFFDSDDLREIAESEIFWDTISAIERVGIRDTYDIEVEDDHNFVADGLIVHNSHSTAYGAVSYQTAYLKAHYPTEFMAALLTCGMEDSARISEHVDDARRMGITIAPPDVNSSEAEFAVIGERQLSFGMAAIKGLGQQVVQAIADERQANGSFKDIFDLAERLDPKLLQKAVLEILIKAGALDSLGPNRAQHLAAVERAVSAAIARHQDKKRGQKNLFGDDDNASAAGADATTAGGSLPEAPDWTHSQKLAGEKDVLGFYLTSHPLTQFANKLEQHVTHDNKQLGDLEDGTEVLLGGMIGSIKKAITKKPSRNGNTKYVNFDLEDPTGIVRCIMWPEDYARLGEKVQPEAVVFVKGKVDRRSREPNVIVNQLLTVDEADKQFTTQLAINFQRGLHGERELLRTREILQRYPGKTDVVLIVDSADPQAPESHLRFVLSTPNQMKVSCNADLQSELTDVIGRAHFQLHTPPKETRTPK